MKKYKILTLIILMSSLLLVSAIVFTACKPNHQINFSEWQVVKKPTCTSDGLERRFDLNNKTNIEERKIPKYNFSEWEVVTPPTTISEGLERRHCLNDNKNIQERRIPKLEHEKQEQEQVKNIKYKIKIMRETGATFEYFHPSVTVYKNGVEVAKAYDYYDGSIDGNIYFELPIDTYTIKINILTEGYTYDEEYTISPDNGIKPYEKDEEYPTITIKVGAKIFEEKVAEDKKYKKEEILHNFNVVDINEKNVELSKQLQPNKMTVLLFFKTKCPHSKEALRCLNDLYSYQGYSDRLSVIAFTWEDEDYDIKYYNQKYKDFIFVDDRNFNIRKNFETEGYPRLYFVDENGVLCDIIAGRPPIKQIQSILDKNTKPDV